MCKRQQMSALITSHKLPSTRPYMCIMCLNVNVDFLEYYILPLLSFPFFALSHLSFSTNSVGTEKENQEKKFGVYTEFLVRLSPFLTFYLPAFHEEWRTENEERRMKNHTRRKKLVKVFKFFTF